MSLCLENLAIHKTNGDALFSEFNLTVEPGEIVTLMGPSGCVNPPCLMRLLVTCHQNLITQVL